MVGDTGLEPVTSCVLIQVYLPPEKESSYNVNKTGQKGGTNGQKELHSGTDYQEI